VDRALVTKFVAAKGRTRHGVVSEAAVATMHKQARGCVTVREILTRAGLSGDAGVRPASLTAYAARREFDRTNRIEDAARLIGSPSLDTTAGLIGYTWQDPGGVS
jgi:hypothetical protein